MAMPRWRLLLSSGFDMAKTLAQVRQQCKELMGDFQTTTFDVSAYLEAINWAQDLVMRYKGFKVSSQIYPFGAYPTGTLPSTWLVVKRVQVVTPVNTGTVPVPIYLESNDTVQRVLDESTVELEDVANEKWRAVRATYMPRRWALVGNKQFTVIPPIVPTSGAGAGMFVRVHVVDKATPVAVDADTLDAVIPDYYQEAVRYAAVAYLMEKDTDLKSMQFKGEMMKSFEYHMAGGVPTLAVAEQDS
jgi:hypothetical protein